ncbi:YihY/virulence factor BrkB family protein [bacterium]|nr:MAG: YihY/virulence factor BrkB family protein [bacterium]
MMAIFMSEVYKIENRLSVRFLTMLYKMDYILIYMNILQTVKDKTDSLLSLKHKGKKPYAKSPTGFNINDWRIVLLETKEAIGNKNISMLAAGVAYFATLAFFPLVVAGVAISSLVIDPSQTQSVIQSVEKYLPGDMAGLVTAQLENAVANQTGNLVAGIIAIALALFAISGAVQNAIAATNIAYSREESRNFIRLRLIALGLTVATIFAGFGIILLLAVNEAALSFLHLPSFIDTLILLLRWPLLIAVVGIGLAAFYKYGPNRKNPHWQWVSWGAVISTAIWLLGTILFFVYVQYFASFSDTYSVFAGIIVLMTWLNLSAFIVLLGAEINYRLEQRTAHPTT